MISLQQAFKKAEVSSEGCSGITLTQVPRNYQLEDLAKHISWKISNNFSQVGTGKSLVSYMYIMHHLLQGRKVVVIMPPTLITQYTYEFSEKVVGDSYCMDIWNRGKTDREKSLLKYKKGLEEYPDILVMSYQIFVKHINDIVRSGHYSVLVADECHLAKNAATNNWSALFRVIQSQGWYYLGMTGTPITRDLDDAYAYIKLKKPGLYRSLEQFNRLHINTTDFGGFKKIIGYKDEQTIRANLNFQTVRRRSVDVLSLDKPNLIQHELPLSQEHKAFYQNFMEDRIIELGDQILVASNQSALRMLAMRLVTNIEKYTEDPIEDNPLQTLLGKVDTLGLGETKLVIFCHFRESVEKVSEALSKYDPAIIYGGKNQAGKFINDDSCRVVVANMQSGGTGFNFQHVSHNILFYEVAGSPALLDQCIGRCQRSGQTEVVNVWLFNYQYTYWARLLKSAFGRDKDTSKVLMDKKTLLQQLYINV
jgi:SNF2 family DNA or RNA helicase